MHSHYASKRTFIQLLIITLVITHQLIFNLCRNIFSSYSTAIGMHAALLSREDSSSSSSSSTTTTVVSTSVTAATASKTSSTSASFTVEQSSEISRSPRSKFLSLQPSPLLLHHHHYRQNKTISTSYQKHH